MKKSFIGLIALMFAVILGSTVFAADDGVTVSVNRRTIDFADQQPIIENDRVLVPLRGVFEAMDAQVMWNQEKQQVTVFSYDNINRLILTLGSNEFSRITFKSLFDVEKETFTSEVSPVAINGRTMVPIYLVADYMYNDVEWIPETRHVKFTSKKLLSLLGKTDGNEEVMNSLLPRISIASDSKDAKIGETVSVKVNLSNVSMYQDMQLFGSFITMYYDNTSFRFDDFKIFKDGQEIEVEATAANGNYHNDSVKLTYLLDPALLSAPTDSAIVELLFTVTDEKGGEFRLSDRYTSLGYDTTVILCNENKVLNLEKAEQIFIDTTPVFIGK